MTKNPWLFSAKKNTPSVLHRVALPAGILRGGLGNGQGIEGKIMGKSGQRWEQKMETTWLKWRFIINLYVSKFVFSIAMFDFWYFLLDFGGSVFRGQWPKSTNGPGSKMLTLGGTRNSRYYNIYIIIIYNIL